jgi:hypothetical protein
VKQQIINRVNDVADHRHEFGGEAGVDEVIHVFVLAGGEAELKMGAPAARRHQNQSVARFKRGVITLEGIGALIGF